MISRSAPHPSDDDLFFRVIEAGLGVLWSWFKYLGRRAHRHPPLGGLYLLVVAPALGLLLQALRENLAVATAPPFTNPPPVFPFDHAVPEFIPWLLSLVIGLVIGFDRWIAWRYDRPRTGASADQTLPQTEPDVCVLGRAYTRRWEAAR